MKPSLLFVTTNSGKFATLARVAEGADFTIEQGVFDTPEIRSNSLEDIAIAKGIAAYEHYKKPVLVLDSGFYLNAFDNFPGPYTNHILSTIGIEGIQLLVANRENKGCYFDNVYAFVDDNRRETFSYRCDGNLSAEAFPTSLHEQWSDLHRVFLPEGSDRCFAAMGYEQYKEWQKSFYNKDPLNTLVPWISSLVSA